MKYIAISAFIASLAVGLMSAGNLNDSAKDPDGKTIFLAQKCQTCHSINSQDIKRLIEPKAGAVVPADLSNEGAKHNSDWISKWLMKEAELDGQKHIKKFKGSDDELKTLSYWIGLLKTKTK
jgi:mono/diheme cytochrome c family protein